VNDVDVPRDRPRRTKDRDQVGPDVGDIARRRARTDLGHEPVRATERAVESQIGTYGHRKAGLSGRGNARDVSVARRIYRDPTACSLPEPPMKPEYTRFVPAALTSATNASENPPLKVRPGPPITGKMVC